jgi:hypothetical protein
MLTIQVDSRPYNAPHTILLVVPWTLCDRETSVQYYVLLSLSYQIVKNTPKRMSPNTTPFPHMLYLLDKTHFDELVHRNVQRLHFRAAILPYPEE